MDEQDRIAKERIKLQQKINNEYVPAIMRKFAKRLNINISSADYPVVKITDKGKTSYNLGRIIGIRPEDLENLEIWGEEFSHYIRNFLRNDDLEHESHASEFFGYLGRRIIGEFTGREYRPNERDSGILDRKKVLAALKENKNAKKKELNDRMNYFLRTDKMPQIPGESIDYYEHRRNILTHHRPYLYASRVDLKQIEDLGEIYRLPDREIRRRFFRKHPVYNDSKLEDKLVIFISIAIISLWIISRRAITGMAISNALNPGISYLLPIALALLFLAFTYRLYRIKNR